MTVDIIKYFAFFLFFLEIGLFLFVIYAIIVKLRERIKERKNDKYKDIKK
jgi:uncharacterized membrane protein YvlD (DUF360 family)